MDNNSSKGGKFGAIAGTLILAITCAAGGWIARELMPRGGIDPMAAKKAMMEKMANATETVALAEVKSVACNFAEKFVAHAEAVQEVDLLPQVDGYVKEVKFREGDLVKAGQILYVLDDERYQAVVNQRRADLTAAEAESRRTERYFERTKKADERGITEKERDDAEAAFEKAKATVLQAKANLIVAEYDCKKAQVFAPITGQIGKSAAHVGDYVAPSKGALAHIVQTDPIRVSFPLTDRAYVAARRAARQGRSNELRTRLILPDGSEYGATGTYDFDDNQMSAETASIMVRLSFPNPDRILVPNSYVTLVADKLAPPEYPTVQQSAVFDLAAGGLAVYVVGDDGRAKLRPVETLPAHDGLIPIAKGLAVGERVVISGTRKLRDGMKVELAAPTPNEENDPDYKPFKLDK